MILIKKSIFHSKSLSHMLLFLTFLLLMCNNGISVENNPSSSRKNSVNNFKNKQKVNGYIIQFSDKPILRDKYQRNNMEIAHEKYKGEIEQILDKKLLLFENCQHLSNNLKKDYIPILGEYFHVFNGIALGISYQEVKHLLSLPYVKEIFPNQEIHKLLHESISIIKAPQIWQKNIRGKGIRIAIIDSGIDYSHDDFGGGFGVGYKVEAGYDFVNHDNDPMDDDGHGTHCAGIAAAKRDNGNDIYEPQLGEIWGVAPDAILYAYKVLDSEGSGYASDAISGIEEAVKAGVDVISISFGGPGDPNDPACQAVDNAFDAGVVVVVAAGNYGSDEKTIASPGSARKAITVGASNDIDEIAWFSSRGPTTIGTLKPDVVAPGVDICSSQWENSQSEYQCVDNDHISMSGTSMATPHVAGLAALLKEKNPDWLPEDIKYTIRTTSDDLGYPVIDQGIGRIDGEAAITLSHPPPIACIQTCGEVSGLEIDINGSAMGPTFINYQLYFKSEDQGSDWTSIGSSLSEVENSLLASWDVSSLPDGVYIIKLEVKGNISINKDFVFLTLNNLWLDIQNYQELQIGKTYNINGSVVKNNFTNYVLDYAKIRYNDSNTNYKIVSNYSIIKSDNKMVKNGILGNFSLNDFPKEDAYYILRLRIFNTDTGVDKIEKIIYVEDPDGIQKGWPITLNSIGSMSSITVEDLDHDGLKESSFCNRPPFFNLGSGKDFYLWNSLGQTLPGWPLALNNPYYTYSTPAIADIDKNGGMEIVITSGERMFIFDYYGKTKAIYDIQKYGKFNPTLADINNDGYLEIIYGSFDPRINVFDHTGNFFNGYPLILDESTSKWYTFNHAVGDINGDNKLDIVCGTDPGKLYAYTLIDRTLHNGYPVALSNESVYCLTGPIIADVDDNGSKEIIYGIRSDDHKNFFYIRNSDGSVYPGWPKQCGLIEGNEQTPAVGDIDGDRDLEIFFLSLKGFMYAWHHNGSAVKGWPKEILDNEFLFTYTQPLLADITGDDKVDVISMANSGERNIIYAWNNDGTLIQGFPKQLIPNSGWDFFSTPAVADIDNDGDVELLAHSYRNDKIDLINPEIGKMVYKVWDLSAPYNLAKMEWPMYMHDARNTGCYTPPGTTGDNPPLVTITNPKSGMVNGIITISANASDDDFDGNNKQIQKLEFYLNGTDSSNKIGMDDTPPYTTTWNSNSVNKGEHLIYAIAYEDVDIGIPQTTQVQVKINVNNNSTGTPVILLNRNQFQFGSNKSGETTNSQLLLITNSGKGILDWSISVNQNWLFCSPSSGIENGTVSITVDPTGLLAGTYTGTITVSDPNAANSPQTIFVSLNVYSSGQTSPPFGEFSTPIHGSTVSSSIPVTGWVLDDIEVESVKIYLDAGNLITFIGEAVLVEGARPDVEQAYPDYPNNYKAGWGYMMLTNFLPNNGNGTYILSIKAIDLEGNQVTLGTKAITVDNVNVVKPFGAIDTPPQGGIAAGSTFINFGWALTPQPNTIPTDGSTISVWVDGESIGHPVYNQYREDIATLFPGYNNMDGAIGYFYLDTTKYNNGVHTIAWSVTDDAGNTDGVGSRYFTIQNSNTGGTQSEVSMAQGIDLFNINNFSESIIIKKGYQKERPEKIKYPDIDGKYKIEAEILKPLEINIPEHLSIKACYSVIGKMIKSILPPGLKIDFQSNKIFWFPGPGSGGIFNLIVIIENHEGNSYKLNLFIHIFKGE